MRAATTVPRLLLLTPFAVVLGLAACDDSQVQPTTSTIITPVTNIGNAYAINDNTGNIISFDRSGATAVRSNLRVQGLAAGEKIVGLDTRTNSAVTPTNTLTGATVYALTDAGGLYRIDPSTGFVGNRVALRPSTSTVANQGPTNTSCMPAVMPYSGLSGGAFGMDFNPAVDRLRVVSESGQNLRINVDTGDVTVDCPFTATATTTGIKPSAAAYTNATSSTAPAASTTLFYIDTNTDQLLTTTAPNGGVLTPVGPLNFNVTAVNGFDIDGTGGTSGPNTAYAVMTTVPAMTGGSSTSSSGSSSGSTSSSGTSTSSSSSGGTSSSSSGSTSSSGTSTSSSGSTSSSSGSSSGSTTAARTFLYTINLMNGAATPVAEFCGSSGTMGSGSTATCINAGDSLRALALRF